MLLTIGTKLTIQAAQDRVSKEGSSIGHRQTSCSLHPPLLPDKVTVDRYWSLLGFFAEAARKGTLLDYCRNSKPKSFAKTTAQTGQGALHTLERQCEATPVPFPFRIKKQSGAISGHGEGRANARRAIFRGLSSVRNVLPKGCMAGSCYGDKGPCHSCQKQFV
eukprot:1138894-Pelagomonas_calceolata.AAC.5